MSETKEPLDNSQEKVVALINSFCGQAMEYCDAAQIFCTMKSDNGKFHRFHEYGRGNWFARFGTVVAWEREQRLSDPGESE